MLRAMLADRFQLKAHIETQERQIFGLVTTATASTPPTRHRRCSHALPARRRTGFDVGNLTMPEFAMWLSEFPAVNATVIDKTGLSGGYDITLRFRGVQRDLAGTGPAPSDYPLLVDALPEQLNLKLERTRGPVEVLIVERAERPSAS
jgi:uncharacterized protein (TIGR03435 family)